MVFFRAFFKESREAAHLPEHRCLRETLQANYSDLEEVFGLGFRKKLPTVLEYMRERESPKPLSVYHATSLFLLDVSRLCSKNFFKEAALFLSLIIAEANKNGRLFEQNLGFNLPFDSRVQYCHQRDAARLPEIAVAFIVSGYGASVEKNAYWLYRQNAVFPNLFGITKESVVRACAFVGLFVGWLVKVGLTNTGLEVTGMPPLVPSFLQDHIL